MQARAATDGKPFNGSRSRLCSLKVEAVQRRSPTTSIYGWIFGYSHVGYYSSEQFQAENWTELQEEHTRGDIRLTRC